MKRLRKSLAIAAFAPMLAACDPTTHDLCNHITELTRKEMGDAARQPSHEETQQFTAQCVQEMEKERVKIGAVEFTRRAKCVIAAQKLADTAKCTATEEAKAE